MDSIIKCQQASGERPVGIKSDCKDTKRKRIVRYLLAYKWTTPTNVLIWEGGQL